MPLDAAAEAPRRILIIKPSSLGDIVHALPILAALREKYPQAHIAWIVANSFASLLEGHPLLDEVIRFDRVRYGRMWRSPSAFVDFWRFVRDVRRKRFDWVIDLQGLIRSGLLSYFSGARRRIGFADARETASFYYNQRVRPPHTAEHAVDRVIALGEEIGLRMRPPQFPLAIRDVERTTVRGLVQDRSASNAPIVAVIPGARWPSKLWLADRYAVVSRRLTESGFRCMLLGAPGERELANEIREKAGVEFIDLVGRTTLRELAALLELSHAVVCQDSGPMHIAAALEKPIVAVFGPTNPKRTGPYAPTARLPRVPLECAPCYRRVCPLGHHRCMTDLTADRVLDEFDGLMKTSAMGSVAAR